MSENFALLLQTIFVGVGATLVMDLWAIIQKRSFDIPSLDYALVGRWAGHFRQRRIMHRPIGSSPAIRHERSLGWFLHYLIGVFLAAMLVAMAGPDWLRNPTLLPALMTGIVSVVLPFFILQPAFGFGVAASQTPHPGAARRRSLIAHLSFGLGLYLAGEVAARLF
jgi:hypothetical protein